MAVEYFHHQLITGDSVDNIPGLFGLGKKKAEKILNGKDIKGQFEAIIKTYKKMHPEDYVERLNVMGTLLYLVKDYDDEKWNIEYWNRYLNEITDTTKV